MEGVFSFLQYDFMRTAFAAVAIITPLFGLLGTMIVHNKMAFFSDALGHSALTGIALGLVLGVQDTGISMIIFAILFALLLNYIKSKNTVSTDTVISVFSSAGIAIGLAVLSKGGRFNQYASLLVGDILSITKQELIFLAVIFAGTVLFWILCFNSIVAISVNEALARSRNIKVKWIENIFAVFIALVVMVSIKWVGILIINALLILPAAAGRNLAVNMREYHFFSVVFSIFSGFCGLIWSYYANIAAGPAIVIIAAVLFFATYIYSVKKG